MNTQLMVVGGGDGGRSSGDHKNAYLKK